MNGHMEHAYPLTAEMYAASWPLPGGHLLIPRLFSDATDAPYLGEAGILYALTRQPMNGVPIKRGGSIPSFTWIVIGTQIIVGLALLFGVARSVQKWWSRRASLVMPLPRMQFALWLGLLLGFGFLLFLAQYPDATIAVLAAQLLPRGVDGGQADTLL